MRYRTGNHDTKENIKKKIPFPVAVFSNESFSRNVYERENKYTETRE